MKKVIINADDFGANSYINQAIIELLKKGIINSTSIMANMPGFDEAVNLAHQHNILNKIGVHLVLTEGNPLTEEIKSINFLFKGKNTFKNPLKHSLFFLNDNIKKLIYYEFAAQIKKIKDSGITITHLDTHHHVHEYFAITKILLELKKEYKIPFIRILNNLNKSTLFYKKIYRDIINYYIIRNKANFSDLFGDQLDVLLQLKTTPEFLNQNKTLEIMVHPDLNSEGLPIDKCGKNHYNFNFVNALGKNFYEESSLSL